MKIIPTNTSLPLLNGNLQQKQKKMSTPNFKGVQEDVIDVYDDKINSVSGWGKKKKIRVLETEKNAAIMGYALAQEKAHQELKELVSKREEELKIARQNNANQQKILELKQKLKEATDLKEIQENLMRVRKNRGWDRIAGYDEEKAILSSEFIQAIGLEKAGEEVIIPNGILFFGPTGNGKTTFAKAFAEQSKCNFKSISETNLTKFSDILEDALKDSKKNYDKDKTRTIILLDEFERYGLKSELGGDIKLIADLKSIFCEAADKYKTTFFFTTNNPQDVDSILFADSRVPVKVYLDPPNDTNAARVFEYYLNEKTTNNININNLVEELMNNKKEGAYSNSKIKAIAESVYKETQNAKRLLTEGDIIDKIRKTLPDITKEHLLKYENDVLNIIGKVR